jgi:hypothetical protein
MQDELSSAMWTRVKHNQPNSWMAVKEGRCYKRCWQSYFTTLHIAIEHVIIQKDRYDRVVVCSFGNNVAVNRKRAELFYSISQAQHVSLYALKQQLQKSYIRLSVLISYTHWHLQTVSAQLIRSDVWNKLPEIRLLSDTAYSDRTYSLPLWLV